MRIQVFWDLWAVPDVLKVHTGLVSILWFSKKDLLNVNILYSTSLPAQQNKGPEQLPSSNTYCVGRIILVLKVFNLPCPTYYNNIFPRLPTSQQTTKTLQSSKRNKPLTLVTNERLTPLTSPRYKSILFTITFRQIHGSSWIKVAAVVLRNSYHRSPARPKIKCVSDNYSTYLLLLPHCPIYHSKYHIKRSKMHGEHGKFIACYTQRQSVLCISCAGLLTTNCKIQVPSSDKTPMVTCGYQVFDTVWNTFYCWGISTYQHIIYCVIWLKQLYF